MNSTKEHVTQEHVLLRAYVRSADRAPHTPTYLRIVEAGRKHKLAGATVLCGILGLGYHGVLKPTAWSWVEHVPIIVEVVDRSDKILQSLEVLKDTMIG